MSSELLPKGGLDWRAARPPARAFFHVLTRTRILVYIALATLIIVLWRTLAHSASGMKKSVLESWGETGIGELELELTQCLPVSTATGRASRR